MRISDCSSDVCSSYLLLLRCFRPLFQTRPYLLHPWSRTSATAPALLYLRHPCRRPVLFVGFSVPSHCIMALRHRAHVGRFKPRSGGTDIPILMFLALFLCALGVLCGSKALRNARRVHGQCPVPGKGTGR